MSSTGGSIAKCVICSVYFRLTEWAKKDAQGKGSDEEEKIKQLEQKLARPKHMYSDPSYMSQIHSVSESMEDALKQGIFV